MSAKSSGETKSRGDTKMRVEMYTPRQKARESHMTAHELPPLQDAPLDARADAPSTTHNAHNARTEHLANTEAQEGKSGVTGYTRDARLNHDSFVAVFKRGLKSFFAKDEATAVIEASEELRAAAADAAQQASRGVASVPLVPVKTAQSKAATSTVSAATARLAESLSHSVLPQSDKAPSEDKKSDKGTKEQAHTEKPVDVKKKHSKTQSDAGRKKKSRKRLQRRSLQEYLDRAGYTMNAERVKRTAFYSVVALFLFITLIILLLGVSHHASAKDLIVFMFGLWTAVFALGLLISWAGVYFFLDYKLYRRTRELEEVLPDFLQLASSNIAAGMPIDRALWYAIRPNFGVLAKEMETVAKATMAGEDLEASLMHMTEKYDSTILRRSISILIEGLHAGGEMADLLTKIALNIDELKIMKKEMAANVTTYAIFIIFASVLIAPCLFALATELVSIIIRITSNLDLSSSSSMLTLGKPDLEVVKNFKIFSVLMLFVSTIFSASIVSVIKRGNVMEGIKSIPVYAAVSLIVYYLAGIMLHAMFAGVV